MRKLIAGMKISLDGMIEGPNGYADWVQAWSEDYGLTPQIDACLLGGGMYPGYEWYWSEIQNDPGKPVGSNVSAPTPKEVEWARFAEQTPHYVLSSSLTSAAWPKTTFIRDLDDIAEIKRRPGKDIYVLGGARITASLVDAGLLDELRLIVYPLIAAGGKALYATLKSRRDTELRKVEQLPDGRALLIYGFP